MILRHRLELVAAQAALWLLRRFSPERASDFGAALARAIGPALPVSRIADRNLALAFPELDRQARRRLVRRIWESLGRTAGEFPHLSRLQHAPSGPGWTYAHLERVQKIVAKGGQVIMFSGHIGNWEIIPLAAAEAGIPFASMYRPADNPAIDALILRLRRPSPGVNELMFPKGAHGARQMLQHLRRGGNLAMLVDQKMNDGIEARFFGRKAMTAPALATLALKLRCPVVGSYVRRIGPARFVVEVEEPLPLPDTGDRQADIRALTQMVNDQLESWIRRAPESWLWLHRRWAKETYADLR